MKILPARFNAHQLGHGVALKTSQVDVLSGLHKHAALLTLRPADDHPRIRLARGTMLSMRAAFLRSTVWDSVLQAPDSFRAMAEGASFQDWAKWVGRVCKLESGSRL